MASEGSPCNRWPYSGYCAVSESCLWNWMAQADADEYGSATRLNGALGPPARLSTTPWQ
jgi:hypothetical protein